MGCRLCLSNARPHCVTEDNNAEAALRLEQSRLHFQEVENEHGIAETLYLLGIVAWGCGDYTSATSLGNEALRLSSEGGDIRAIGNALNLLSSRDVAGQS